MATLYGNVTNNWRAYMDWWWESYDDRVEYHAVGGVESQNYGFDINSGIHTLININNATSEYDYGMWSGYGETKKTQVTYQLNTTVYRKYGESQSIYIGVQSINSSGFMNGTSYGEYWDTVSARPYSIPSAPTNCKAARNSATKCTVTWTNNATSTSEARPYTGIIVQRSANGGSWSNIATLGVVTSYTDNTTSDGNYYSYRVVAKNSAGNSGASNTATIYSPALAPTGLAVSRSSDTSIALKWNSTASAARPWSAVKVYRQDGSGSTTQVATLGSSTSWTDGSVKAGHRYRYYLAASNSFGGNETGWSSYVYTTPDAISGLTATKPTTTTVKLSGTKPAYADGYEFQVSANGGASWQAASLSADWTDSAPPAGQIVYRARAYKAQGGSTNASAVLYSAWAQSNSVQTIVAPNAPAVTLGASVLPYGENQTVTWTRNHPDGTGQSKAQVEITDPSGTAQTVDVAGATASHEFTPNANGTWKVRVRTHGLYDAWGAWSGYQTFTMADLPSATFTFPATDGAKITKLPLEATWDASDSTGISSQHIELHDAGGSLIAQLDPATDQRAWGMTPALGLANEAGYTLTLMVRGGSSLESTATRTFLTEWTNPNAATVDTEVTDGLGVRLFVREKDHSDALEAITVVDVVRVNPDGSRVELAHHVQLGYETTDPIPPLGVGYAYEVTSYAAVGATALTVVENLVESHGKSVLSFGYRADRALVAELNPTLDGSYQKQGDAFHFADGGERGGLPSWYALDSVDVSHNVGFSLVGEDAFRSFRADYAGESVCYYRDPMGGVSMCNVGWSWSATVGTPVAFDVTAQLTELAWEEPPYA